jgi:hypothetical protein
MKRILSLCDYTGNWPSHYKEAGYEVIQVDLKLGHDARLWPSNPSEAPRLSSQFADVLDLPPIHGIMAAPVCTCFAGSGARHPRSDDDIREALALVDACIRIAWVLKPQWWVMENPVGKLRKWIGPPRYGFNPYEFGGYLEAGVRSHPAFPAQDAYSKKTLLWGNFNIPEPRPVAPVGGSFIHAAFGGKSDKTKECRSATPLGFAKAFFLANP